jgi:predicted DNA-binding WGR domain protein
LWILNSQNRNIPPKSKIYEVELEAIDELSNQCKTYTLSLEYIPSDENKFHVTKSYGRIGKARKSKVTKFQRMELALKEIMASLEIRKKTSL